MKAVLKTTKPIGRGKSKTKKAQGTLKVITPKTHEKKTESKQEDESVRHNRDLLLALSRAAQAVQRTRTPEQVYRVVGEEIKTLGYSLMIFSLSNDREHLNIAYTTIAANLLRAAEKLTRLPMQSYRLPIQAESIFGRVVAGARAEFLPSTRDTVAQVLPKVLRPLAGQLMTLLKVERGIVAPLCADGATLGVLAVTASVLREIDVPAVETFAAQVAISLLNARLAQQAQEELEERERAEKDLRESEERFRTLIENASDMILTITADGNLNYVSSSALRITGYQADEVIGRNIVEFIHADDLPLALQALASRSKISGLAPDPIELRFHHKDGMWRIVEILGNNLLEYPAVKGIVLNVRDITERKRVEESIALFRTLIDHSNDAIEVFDPATARFLDVNEKSCADLGYTRQEYLALTVFDIDPAVDRSAYDASMERLRNSGSMFWEGFHRRKNGSTFPVEVSLRLVPLDRDYIVSVARDITERKRAEEALSESRAQLAGIIDAAMDAIILVGPDQRILGFNPAAEKMFGYPATNAIGQPLALLIPERFRGTHQEQFAGFGEDGRTTRAMGSLPVLAGIRANGEEFPVEISISRVEVAGKRLYTAIARDVTDRKQAEAALRESEDRYRDLVENSQDLICTHDLDGHILSANPRAEKMLGYEHTALLQMNFRDILAPEARPGLTAYLRRITKRGADQGQMIVQTKTGERRIWEYNNTLRTEGVSTPIVRGMARDITERKQAEKALRKSEDKFSKAFRASPDVLVISRRADGLIIEANDSWESLFGYSREEALGRRSLELGLFANPADRQRAVAQLQEQGFVRDFEVAIQQKSGAVRQVTLSVEPIEIDNEPCMLTIIHDITERKLAEEEIETLARFPAENPNPILRVQPNGVILYANAASEPVLAEWNCKVGDALPLEWRQLIADSAASQSKRMRDVQCGGKVFSFWVAPISPAGYVNLYGRDITERKQAEELVKNSEKRFRALIENGRDNISLLAADGTLLWESPSTGSVLGYAPNQFVGSNIFDLMHPDDQAWTRDLYAQVVQTPGSAQEGAFRLLHADGTWRWIECSAANLLHEPSVQAIVINYRDITGRKRTEEALKKSENEYRRLFESANDVIVIFEPQEEIILEANAAACAAYGYAHDELVGMSLKQFTRNVGNGVDHIREFLAGKPLTNFESVHFNKDGVDRHFLINCALIEYQDRKAIMSINRDVTERRQAEEEIKSQLDELQRWQDVMLGRGDREQKLKREVNELCRRVGESARYPSQEIGPADSETALAKS